MKKVLIICHHRTHRSPGQRFRYEQYISFLEEHGYTFHTSILLNEKDDKIYYLKGKYFRKGLLYIKTLWKRTRDWLTMNRYDIIFVFREALMTGSVFLRKDLPDPKRRSFLILMMRSGFRWCRMGIKSLRFLKNTGKTETIIRLVDLVFAGNRFLADYAAQFNKNIAIIPTTIDTELYIPVQKEKKDNIICIGWSGSFSTIQHFSMAIPALKRIKEQFGPGVQFKIIGDADYYCAELETQGVAWKAATEIEDLSEIDIGIMPLPDDEWSKGKCGLKGLQYMALEIPALMSPVGVNTEIIQHGINGYLPGDEDEWVEILALLIRDKQKRHEIGKAGRQMVINKYSVAAVKQQYLENFDLLTEKIK